MDAFQIILDTYHDEQNGFVFGTNPAGLEYDGQVVNQGARREVNRWIVFGCSFLPAARWPT